MTWPNPTEYQEAIQNPRICFKDQALKAGTVATTQPLGLPHVMAGNFAAVYQVLNGSRRWAVRCFLRQVTDQHRRYSLLSQCLEDFPLETLVGFEYLEQGILISGQWRPIVKMEWVEGAPFNTFIERHLNDRQALIKMANKWRAQVVNTLRGNQLAHGDLQHGNILVDAQGKMMLVDYDAMFVPALQGEPSPELGHPNFQHPGRVPEYYNEDLDNFPAIVIFTSLRALAAEPNLWKQFNTGENLILSASDYKNPKKSVALQQLKRSPDTTVKNLADIIEQSCLNSISEVPEFEDAVKAASGSGPTRPLIPGSRTKRLKTTIIKPKPNKQPKTQPLSTTQPGGQPSWWQRVLVEPQTNPPLQPSTTTPVAGPAPVSAVGQITALLKTRAAQAVILAAIVVGVAVWWLFIRAALTPINYNGVGVLKRLPAGAEVTSLAFSPDETTLFAGSSDGKVRAWDMQSGLEKRPLDHKSAVNAVAISANGKLVASSGADFNAKLWDATTGEQRGGALRGHTLPINSIAFSPNGTLLAAGGDDGTVRVWDITSESYPQLQRLEHGSAVRGVAFSPDGSTLLAGSADGKLRLWDVKSGGPRWTQDHSSPINAVAFAADGKTVASGGMDAVIKLWEAQTGQLKGIPLRGNREPVLSIAFSPDSMTLISGGSDRSVRLWDLQSPDHAVKKTLEEHRDGGVQSVAVSADQKVLASGGKDRFIMLWKLN